jgi:hypothetical protein
MIRRLTPRWRLRATGAALLLPPLIHLVSLERIAAWIGRSQAAGSDPSVDDAALAEWVDRVLSRLPPPWKHTCLRRALVLHYLLHRAGRPAGLRIGVRRDENQALAAHAWLVNQGEQPYLEPNHEHAESYQVLAAFPPIGPARP